MAARVRFEVKDRRAIDKLAKSGELAAALEPFADAVLEAARRDPNEAYVASLRKRIFVTGGRAGRVSWQVGAHPVIGSRVEAKRGTLQRALGAAGL